MTEQDAPKLDDLADRVAAARERSSAMAADAAARARDFVQDHPVATVAGGIVIGGLIAGVLSRRRRAITTPQLAATADAAAARLARLAEIGVDMALAYATRAATAGKDGAHKVEESVSKNSAEASRKVVGLATIALSAIRDAGETLREKLDDVKHNGLK